MMDGTIAWGPAALSLELAAAVNRETQGERLLWQGQPDPRRVARLSRHIRLFAVFWLAFALPLAIEGASSFVGKLAHANSTMDTYGSAFRTVFFLLFVGIGVRVFFEPSVLYPSLFKITILSGN